MEKHPWPHLSTRHDELIFEHHSIDPRDDMPGCLVIRPPAGKVVHLGLSRPMQAAPEMIAALRDAEVALQHSTANADHYPEAQSRHFAALLRVRRAISQAGG